MPRKRSRESTNGPKFAGKSHPLSNFSPIAVDVEGVVSPNGEAAFHAAKFRCVARISTGERQADLLARASAVAAETDPAEARLQGGKGRCRMDKDELEDWDSGTAESIQLTICRFKYKHSQEVRTVLQETDGLTLLHQDNHAGPNTPWGGKVHKETGKIVGQNKLGKIWEAVRQENRPK
jgi:predicted NAD-dependent protein-ADP-ribosyltransferase YbiA (DUF1768 family)